MLDLGVQMLTGVFPATRDESITRGPLRLLKCHGGPETCGLLQLEHSYDLAEMYGDNYGYRSGLNPSMVAHLQRKVARIRRLVPLTAGDLVIDIGSNDGTTLRAYEDERLTLVGVDPTGAKFRDHYPAHVALIPDFFSGAMIRDRFPGRQAKVVTAFSMFYDLKAPLDFMRQVHEVMADDGVWVFEQAYLGGMLQTNAYDTVCHEHLEFYGLSQIRWMADRAGFTIVDVELNDVNGGSISVTVAKSAAGRSMAPEAQAILDAEAAAGPDTLAPFHAFEERARASRAELLAFLRQARTEGKTVAAMGASTKGNVLLQYCGLGPDDLPAVGEVNPDKFGCFTPGTWIPIIPETELLARKPDYVLVLPWHFRAFFEQSPAFKGVRLVYPLPRLAISEGAA